MLPQNERGTARFATNPGYVPPLRSEVIIYDTDGTTPLFGGVLFQRSARGQRGSNRHLFIECECADWTWYLDRVTIPGGAIDTPFITLKAALEWLVANLLTPYGFTLDPAQATGPSGPWKFEWERKYVSEILRDLTNASGGWIWKVNPLKRLRMIPPTIVTPTAPFGITDTNRMAHELRWTETSEQYATRLILRCGGEGTKTAIETWTVTAGDIANGYIETTAPSTPTGPVAAKINTVTVTIGTSGTQLIWNWETHRITAGTVTPVIGNVIELTYTAQYPFEVIEDAGVTPAIEMVIDQPDLTDPATARDVAVGLLAQHVQSPRTFDVVTFTAGLRPGQVLSIDSAQSVSSSLTALITEVRISLLTNQTWRYQATAVAGIYQGSALDYFRGLGGVATGSGIIITGAAAPGVVARVLSAGDRAGLCAERRADLGRRVGHPSHLESGYPAGQYRRGGVPVAGALGRRLGDGAAPQYHRQHDGRHVGGGDVVRLDVCELLGHAGGRDEGLSTAIVARARRIRTSAPWPIWNKHDPASLGARSSHRTGGALGQRDGRRPPARPRPGAPTIGTASAISRATVNFTPPASDGGSPITLYTATSSPGGLTATCKMVAVLCRRPLDWQRATRSRCARPTASGRVRRRLRRIASQSIRR